MLSREIFDVASLLAPIGEDDPTGPDLRDDPSPQSIYYRLKDARSAARTAERQADADAVDAGLLPEWRTIFNLSVEALSKRSKDLEVACWLLEASVRAEGFAGLNAALAVMRGLVDRYWDRLHSLQDEDGMATFVAPFSGLNGVDGEGTLIPPIRKVPITGGADAGPFAAYHFDQAQALQQIADKNMRQKRIDAGVPTVEVVERALISSPRAFLKATLIDLKGSIGELDGLSGLFSEKCGSAAPPTSTIRNALEAVFDLMATRTRSIIPPSELEPAAVVAAVEEPEAAVQGGNGAAAPTPAARPSDRIDDRDDALRLLSKVSEFFRTREPHSPIAFALDDLVRRARLTLPELLAELLPDAAARRTLLTNAGIRPPPDA